MARHRQLFFLVLVGTMGVLSSGCALVLRASVGSNGAQSPLASTVLGVSSTGRYEIFSTSAALDPADTNIAVDIYVRDVEAGTTALVSVRQGGGAANGPSAEAAISDDGQRIAFSSDASNLVTGDTNGVRDVFVRNRASQTTVRVSAPPAFIGGEANGPSRHPALDGAGDEVAFTSDATNLVSGDTNAVADVFTTDSGVGVPVRQSVPDSSVGGESNGPSAQPHLITDFLGSWTVVFSSTASNLVSGDSNAVSDVFVRTQPFGFQGPYTARVSIGAGGTQANGPSDQPTIATNGLLAYRSAATDLVADDGNAVTDIFVTSGDSSLPAFVTTTRVNVAADGSEANGASGSPSAAPGVVSFESDATNLIVDDTNAVTDIFARDLPGSNTVRVSQNENGIVTSVGNGPSTGPSQSADGRYTAFTSRATNLNGGDTNAVSDAERRRTFVPTITYVTPVNTGRTSTLTVLGRYFTPDFELATDVSGLTINSITSRTDTTIVADVTIANTVAAGTSAGVTLTNSFDAGTSCTDCLDIGPVVLDAQMGPGFCLGGACAPTEFVLYASEGTVQTMDLGNWVSTHDLTLLLAEGFVTAPYPAKTGQLWSYQFLTDGPTFRVVDQTTGIISPVFTAP